MKRNKLYVYCFLFALLSTTSVRLFAQLENLGGNVNSPSDELQPIVTPDGKTLWFARLNHPENVGGLSNPGQLNQDIWYSTSAGGTGWNPAKNMQALNSPGNDFVSSVSPDGNIMMIKKSLVRRTKTGWTSPDELNIVGFAPKGNFATYFLANDGKTLLMSIGEASAVGQNDLFVSFRQPDGSFSKPMNLGRTLNTFGNEFSPFLASDGVTLFFSSDGHPGTLGNNDIYVTRRQDATWRNWSKPENLGPTINTKGFDSYFVIPACGDYAYMVSKENSLGGTDIFRLQTPSFAKPKPVLLLTGTVLDAFTNDPLTTQIEYVTSADKQSMGEASTNPATGEFTVVLPVGQKYIFYNRCKNYQTDSIVFDLTGATECKFEDRKIKLTPSPTIISGKVTNAINQKPIANAKIVFKGTSGKEFEATADGSGRYTLKIEGSVAGGGVTADATGYKQLSENITFSENQRHNSFEKNFEMKSSAVILTGTVRNAANNAAVPNATVKYKLAQGGKDGEVKANAEGQFRIEVEAESVSYALTGEAYGFRPGTAEVAISPDQQNVTKDVALTPRPPILLYGKVTNEVSGAGIDAKMRYIAKKNKEEGMAKANEGGEYKIEMPYLTHYKFIIKKDGYISIYENFTPDTTQNFQEIQKDFKLLPIDIGTTVRLNNIQFEFAKATLLPESFEDLDRLVELMNDASTLVIEIAGHTDDVGDDESNKKLSHKRAESVRDYILSKGITTERIEAKGYGESKPLVSNKTDKDRAINRRVEFRVLRK